MAGDLFLMRKEGETLRDFALRVGAFLGLNGLERRASSSYADEEYYTAEALSLKVTIAWADENDLETYEFWIHLEVVGARIDDASFVDALADLLARRLAISGERVVRLPDAAHVDTAKVFYTFHAGADPFSPGAVTTRTE